MDERLVKTLQGDSWNGHPIHPALVTLPIGIWHLGAVLDLIALFSKNECVQEAADYAVTAGLVGAGMSAVAGLAEYQRVPQSQEAKDTALTHAAVNVSAVALNSINAIVRNGRRGAGKPGGMLPKLLSWSVIGLVNYSGWLGGKLVYNLGTAVDTNREQRFKEQKQARKEDVESTTPPEYEVRAHV